MTLMDLDKVIARLNQIFYYHLLIFTCQLLSVRSSDKMFQKNAQAGIYYTIAKEIKGEEKNYEYNDINTHLKKYEMLGTITAVQRTGELTLKEKKGEKKATTDLILIRCSTGDATLRDTAITEMLDYEKKKETKTKQSKSKPKKK